jgi:hypothetical protein
VFSKIEKIMTEITLLKTVDGLQGGSNVIIEKPIKGSHLKERLRLLGNGR